MSCGDHKQNEIDKKYYCSEKILMFLLVNLLFFMQSFCVCLKIKYIHQVSKYFENGNFISHTFLSLLIVNIHSDLTTKYGHFLYPETQKTHQSPVVLNIEIGKKRLDPANYLLGKTRSRNRSFSRRNEATCKILVRVCPLLPLRGLLEFLLSQSHPLRL